MVVMLGPAFPQDMMRATIAAMMFGAMPVVADVAA